MSIKEARETVATLVSEGICTTHDEAVHMLADMGEINSTQHAQLLSKEESERVYG